MLPATLLLLLSSAGGAIDLLYLHLWKYRLHQGKETLREHKLHTMQAILATLTVFLLFCANFGGLLLWAGVCVIFLGLVVDVMDIICEKRSRAALGGVSSFEYAIHVIISGIRFAMIALVLNAKPIEAWGLSADFVLREGYSTMTVTFGWIVVCVGILLVALHLWVTQSKYRKI